MVAMEAGVASVAMRELSAGGAKGGGAGAEKKVKLHISLLMESLLFKL